MGQVFGTSHSIEELERVWPAVIYMPMAEQAKYADVVTRSHVHDDAFLDQTGCSVDEMKSWSADFIKERINTTSIGNGAFNALHNLTRPQCQDEYQILIAKLKEVFPQNEKVSKSQKTD